MPNIGDGSKESDTLSIPDNVTSQPETKMNSMPPPAYNSGVPDVLQIPETLTAQPGTTTLTAQQYHIISSLGSNRVTSRKTVSKPRKTVSKTSSQSANRSSN